MLFYYYHNAVRITDEAYLTLQQVALDDSVLSDMARIWLNLIENQLEAEADLQSFVNNPYLKAIGPYYYPETNTRFYFCKEVPEPQNVMTAFDLELLKQLDSPTAINRELQQYAKTRKNKKNSTADLIREMDMCILALREIERINRHTNYLRKLLEQRYAIVEQENLLPCEPDGVPEKPIKESEERRLDNIIPFSRVRGLRKNRSKKAVAITMMSKYTLSATGNMKKPATGTSKYWKTGLCTSRPFMTAALMILKKLNSK